MIIGISGKIGSGKDLVGSIIQYLIYNKTLVDNKQLIVSYNDFIKLDIIHKRVNWKIVKWADSLKDIVCILLNCTREQLEDTEFKNKELGEEWNCYITPQGLKTQICIDEQYNKQILTPRKLLQLLGTECGRQIIHPNIWVNVVMNNYILDEGYSYDAKIINDNTLKITSNATKFNHGYPNWIITDTRFPNEANAIRNNKGINIRVQREIENTPLGIGKVIRVNEHISETALDFYRFDYVINNNGTINELIDKVKEILIKEQII